MSIPPQVPEKKGMSCLGVGGVGCLVIIVGFLAAGGFVAYKYGPKIKAAAEEYQRDAASSPDKAAAKLGLKFIPDVVIVREDDAAKTITYKMGAAGEEMTMHYDGMTSGKTKPKITNSKGEVIEGGDTPAPTPVPATDSVTPPATPAPQN